MKKIALIALMAACLAACAPMEWQKLGASQSDFARDRYACLQQSQQQASSAYVSGNAGVASSGAVTNGGLFGACMNASGWYLATGASSRAIPSNFRYDQKGTEKHLGDCSANNASSDEIAACMQRFGSGNNL